MLKKDLRAKYQSKRQKLPSAVIAKGSITIANTLLTLPIWSHNNYHLFLSIEENKEVDTSFMLSILQGKDKNIVLSKVTSETDLKHFLLTDQTVLKKNKWNIPEPTGGIEVPLMQLDVVFIPLLAFDKKGNRIGYGKGFYDRFLSRCKPDIIRIGLSLFEAEPMITDINASDIPLHYCVTPKTVYNFTT